MTNIQPVLAAYTPPAIKSQGWFVAADPIALRIFDVVVAAVLLVVFLPVMVIIATAVFVANPGPVFFSQQRVGRDGGRFWCYKFRTMATDAEARLDALIARDPEARAEWNSDHKLREDPRIVGIGKFLRKSSLDELPQLWNVIKGDMSLVGPRPIVEAEMARYGKYFVHYCAVRPGITGLWQVNGRNDVSYRRRVACDVIYARSCRVTDNIRILLLTVPRVLTSRGTY